MRTTTLRLNDILCQCEQRYVGAQLTFHYDRKQIILEQTDMAKGLEGQYVELFDFWDKPLEVRWRGHVLPYRVFSKDQRVSHTAIVENKRLGHALAIVNRVRWRGCKLFSMGSSTSRRTSLGHVVSVLPGHHLELGSERARSRCSSRY